MIVRTAAMFTICAVVSAGAAQTAASSASVRSRAVRECAACHPAQAKPHPMTSMAHALELPAECAILKTHPRLTFKDGAYSYRIERKGDQSIYSVTDGQQTISAPIEWAFGLGGAGQTYVFTKDGQFYQSRVSFYRDIDALDFTLGALNEKPKALAEATGQLMDQNEKLACFGCHATDATEARQLALDKMTPGVQCERCHGSADNHVENIQRGNAKLAKMNDLRSFSSEQMSNFCGQCHRTWDQIAASGVRGLVNVRFQPYRLTNSKCYDADDPRIRCTSCHDPHQEVNRKDIAYDSKCQACHGGGKAAARACKVAKSDCVSCHMPKVEIPGSHFKFSDHQIRIVRANAPFPD
jgi:hypothetical protein